MLEGPQNQLPVVEWRSLPWLPDYEISSDGRIRRATTVMQYRAGTELSPHMDRGGYRRLELRTPDGPRKFRIARLVCEAFNGPPPSGEHQSAHNDGCRTNDRSDNLRWATPLENTRDKYVHGTMRSGLKAPSAKLRADDVRLIRKLRATGMSVNAMSKRLSHSRMTITRILRGDTYRDVA